MNSWYFTFEFPPEYGGGLATYMRCVTAHYRTRPDQQLVVFAVSRHQSGLRTARWIADNILLITINPLRAPDHQQLGYWVTVSHLFERFADLLMADVESGRSAVVKPDYLEFADGFGIGALTIQQKLCLNSRLQDTPIVVLAHTPTYLIDQLNQAPLHRLPRYWIREMELMALHGADAVISPSQALVDELNPAFERRGTKLNDVLVLPNPYVPAAKAEAFADPEEDPGEHFFMVSRLTHWKGAENAIKALQVLWSEGLEIPFHLYGEDDGFHVTGGSYRAHLEKCYPAEIERGLIRFMGLKPRAEIDLETRTAIAQLHPSDFDNFPYSLLEAMHEGTISVAGRRGGIGEIAKDGREIFLTDVTSPDTFAQTLRQVMGLQPVARAEIARAARAAVETRCDPGRYFPDKEAYLSQIASRAHVRRHFPFLSPAAPAPSDAEDDADAPIVLSVVVPYFNMGAFIDETIASLCRATLPGIEILLVNDGSTEPDSLARLNSLHADHGLSNADLQIITIPNGGVAKARNTGAEAARGRYLALLDADDMVASRYYEKAVQILDTYSNVSFVGCWIEDFDEAGRRRNWATWNAEPPIQLILNQTNCQSLVYRRAAFLSDGKHDPDLRMFLDDWEGVIAMIAAGHRGVMIPEAMFHYRIRQDSVFRVNTSLWDLNYEKIAQKHHATYENWGSEIAAFLNANGPSKFYNVLGKDRPALSQEYPVADGSRE